ncbi:FG-GAP-like repeat-containing protein [Verrucomicrobia bacterium]|nr:FG-GAP-like repeat-containing protein [Verrucomicrobiota bacterium]MDA7657536.1 FG-GAP-like repeat-containing protein [Verrucomicrobiota bacterium]
MSVVCVLWLNVVMPLFAQPTPSSKPHWLLPEEPLQSKIRPQRIQIIDINQDLYPDIAAISMRAIELWQNDRLGGYEKVITFEGPEPAMAVELGDWDGDGALDFVSVGSPASEGDGVEQPRGTPISVWLNRGNEGFVRGIDFFLGGADVRHDYMSVVSGDLNGDERVDLVVMGTVIRGNLQSPVRLSLRPSASASVFLSRGDGGFEPEVSIFENSPDVLSLIQLGDLDGDGDLDFVRSVDLGAGRQVWINSGNGRFEEGQESARLEEDLFSMRGFGRDRRFYDADGDGDLDIIVPGLTSENFVYINDGAGRLQSLVLKGLGRFSSLVALHDLNGDGLPDFLGDGDTNGFGYTAEEVSQSPISIRLGNENGGFDALQTVSGASPRDLVVSDLNRDQALDIVVLSDFGIEVWLQGPPVSPSQAGMMPVAIKNPEVRQRIGVALAKDPKQITTEDLATIKELNLADLDMTSVSLPAGLTRMDSLILDGNRLSSLELPSDARNVKVITIRENRSAMFTLEGRFPFLQRLVLTGEDVRGLSIEGEVPQLGELSLWSTRIRDFRFLGQISSLQVLNLSGMALRAAVLPMGIPNLEQLTLSSNPLTEMVVPRGFSVRRLEGSARPDFVYYDDAFIGEGQARITGFEVGNASLEEITVMGGPGTYQIEFSSSLKTWDRIGELTHLTVETTTHSLGLPEAATGYYRVSRTGP